MKLRFTKMHGLGNDFVVIDATRAPVDLTPARVKAIADRHFGVGCDQLLVVEPASRADVDFRYRIFNADGGEVEQCGNGARCFVRFVHDKGLTAKAEIRVETRSGIIAPRLRADGLVTVDMGVPLLARKDIPFAPDDGPEPVVNAPVTVDGKVYLVTALSTATPPGVSFVDDVWKVYLADGGPKLERDSAFARKANIEFAKVHS